MFAKEGVAFLNSTPREPQSLRLWHFVPCFGCAEALAEQPARASLTSELADSALLGYLRRRLRCKRRRMSGKSHLLRQKRKIRKPEWTFRIFGGEGEI